MRDRSVCAAAVAEFNLDAPKAKIMLCPQQDHLCPDPRAKISCFRFSRNHVLLASSRLMQRGVRVVTIRRGGERWPRACQVLLRWTIGSPRTVKPCGPGAPMLALSPDDMTCHQDDGGNKAGPRGEHGAAVKTIAQGGPGRPAEPVVPAACIFFRRRATGLSRGPAFPAPLRIRRGSQASPRTHVAPRERRRVSR
jgi:hypothetical protein